MIIVVCAMMDEARTIAHYLVKKEEYPFPRYEGYLSNKEVVLIVSGIGKANAASALTYAFGLYPKAELVINLGIAGGYKVERHQVYMIEEASYHDVDVTIFDYEKGQVPAFPTWYQSDPNMMNKLPKMARTKLYTGDIFSTTNFVETPYVVDMEGTSFYQVAHRFKYPIISIKMVSDVIGSKTQVEDYVETEIDFAEYLYDELLAVLEVLE